MENNKIHTSNYYDKSGVLNNIIRPEGMKNPHLHIAHNPDGLHMDLTLGNGVKLNVNPKTTGWSDFFKNYGK